MTAHITAPMEDVEAGLPERPGSFVARRTMSPDFRRFVEPPNYVDPAEMSVISLQESRIDLRKSSPDIEIVIPVFNEAPQLIDRITQLRRYLDEAFPFRALVTVVDNASTDSTYAIASDLAIALPGVAAMHLRRKGRGHALRTAWSTSTAPVVAYMDVDLSTSLTALLPLVAPLISGHGDVAIGTRLAPGARVIRGPKRELISRAYNLILRLSLRGRFSDAQCGFKALTREAAQELLPLVVDDEWFFDTELLVTAERLGMRISEIPVDWIDDPDSRVQIFHTSVDDLRGVWRISHRATRRIGRPSNRCGKRAADADQLLRFAGVGIVSTLVYLGLFVALRPLAGTLGASALALALCTGANTFAHRELGRSGQSRAHLGSVGIAAAALFAFSLALTTVALLGAQAIDAASLSLALVAVTAASAAAAMLRFVVLRAWVFPTSGKRSDVD